MKLKCLGQPAPRTGPITVQEMKFRRVQRGEILEVDETLAAVLMDTYKGRFVVAKDGEGVEKKAEPPKNKMIKKETARNKKTSAVDELL